jgi:hypothetical protein
VPFVIGTLAEFAVARNARRDTLSLRSVRRSHRDRGRETASQTQFLLAILNPVGRFIVPC